MAFLAGQDLTAAILNGLLTPSIANLRQTTLQTLAHGTYTAITFDSEDIDTDGGHSNVTNNSRYTIQRQGYYEVSGGVGFDVNTTGGRATRWAVNGTAVNGSSNQTPANGAGKSTCVGARVFQLFLFVGDFVQLQGWQDSGGNLNTIVVAETQSTMTVRWIRD